MNCVVTAGPTYEPLDDVRRLTNFSTGKLGTELANHLVARGHYVTLLVGEQATYRGDQRAQRVETFTTTAHLQELLQALSTQTINAVFHAAAVSDFSFGKIWLRSARGEMTELKGRKISTREGTLFAELTPTPKIIAGLRAWFPASVLVGWKFEMDGNREDALRAGERQLNECLTDACVVNGAAYGDGFGVLGKDSREHANNPAELYAALEKLLRV